MVFKKNFRNQKRKNFKRFDKKGSKKFKHEDNENKVEEKKPDVIQHVSSDESSSEEEINIPNSMARLLSTFGTTTKVETDSEEELSDEGELEDESGVESGVEGEIEEGESETNEKSHTEENESVVGTDEEIMEDSDDEIEDEEVEREIEKVMDKIDPFQLHFERNLGKANGEQIDDTAKWSSCVNIWDGLGKIKVESPSIVAVKKTFLLLDEVDDSPLPDVGIKIVKNTNPINLSNLFFKEQLQKNINSNEDEKNITEIQGELLSIITQYADLYYPESTHEKWDNIRTVYSLHAVNHILKTRKKIIQHNGKINLKKLQGNYNDSYRDQGYTRPKVLILLPFKHSAYMVVHKIISLLFGDGKTADIKHLKRFEEDFGPPEKSTERINRPEDFNKIFEGDISEDFKIGITITKNCLKLYTDFYNSDIIIASPLGLRYTVGTKGEKDFDCDFLSSVEILIMDQADVFMMQNWEHLLVLMESLNNLPRDIQKLSTDLTRIRFWSLDGLSKLYRQTIVFASTLIDHNRALFMKGRNFAGRAQVLNIVKKGSVSEVVVPSELILYKINGVDADSRFNYFTQKFLPNWRTYNSGHTLLYIPDYCDYVRLVRFIKEDGGSNVATINEYMVGQNSKVAKARSLFFDGKRQMLVYTERFHFYRRYRIKGVQHVIFYDLPTYPHFFPEICNLMVDSLQNPKQPPLLGAHQITCLYQSCSARLIGVLGAERAAKIAASQKPIHMCSIGS